MDVKRRDKLTFPELVYLAGKKLYGVTLPALYLDLVIEGKLTLKEAANELVSHDTEYFNEHSQALH